VQDNTGRAVEVSDRILDQIVSSVESTASLTTQMSYGIKEHIHAARDALGATEQMQSLAKHITTATREQSLATESIVEAVAQMNTETQEVSMAMQNQKMASTEVVESMKHISRVANQNADATEQLSSTAALLLQHAERLRELAERFQA